MFKNRFLLLLDVLSLLLVAMAVSRPFPKSPKSANLSWPPRPVIIPGTGVNDLSDYRERHPELRASVVPVTGNSEASDYFQRHPNLSVAGVSTPLAESRERPGMACESPVDCR
ncbi:MAG TPA: hypothetical protein VFY83_09220 [Anaerolineales bacterium]|nr:hypothetical protein [Anaerolineales bacterium]